MGRRAGSRRSRRRWSCCRCTFLDRTGHVGAGDTSDMQAGSPGRIPCGIRPADARVRHGAHGRSEAQDGRRLAGRRGGCDDGARPVRRAAGAWVFVSRPRACRVIVGGGRLRRRVGVAAVDRSALGRIPFFRVRLCGRGTVVGRRAGRWSEGWVVALNG